MARKKPSKPRSKAPSRAKSGSNGAGPARRDVAQWMLRLYVAGNTPNSVAAFANLKDICEIHLGGKYEIEVVDLLRQPQLAAGDQIIAVPTLVRKLPRPVKKIIGDLSNTERVLVGLDLRPTAGVALRKSAAGR